MTATPRTSAPGAVPAPRVVIAGTRSGVGKTTVTLGVLGALRRRGLKVQPFKVGPDYIDGSYHTAVAGLPSRNLDAWLLPPRDLPRLAGRAAAHADVSVIEGVMGLFDGRGPGDFGSTAHIARLLRAPVVLVADASASSRSVGAEVLGFHRADPHVPISGVIVNRVAGEAHAETVAKAVRKAGVPLLGCLPSDPTVSLPERHLGLIPVPERGGRRDADRFLGIADLVARHADLDRLLSIARSALPLPAREPRRPPPLRRGVAPRPRIGVAFDAAFNFYYRDGLEALESAGADLVPFSPVAGETPDVDAYYLGGGFPETNLDALRASPTTRAIRKACESGTPVLAECGGMMYLTRSIAPFKGRPTPMVGFLDARMRMVPRLTLAYTEAVAKPGCLLALPREIVHGHEFHASEVEGVPRDARFAYYLRTGTGLRHRKDGWIQGGTMASYMHTHLAAGHKARRFVHAVRRSMRA